MVAPSSAQRLLLLRLGLIAGLLRPLLPFRGSGRRPHHRCGSEKSVSISATSLLSREPPFRAEDPRAAAGLFCEKGRFRRASSSSSSSLFSRPPRADFVDDEDLFLELFRRKRERRETAAKKAAGDAEGKDRHRDGETVDEPTSAASSSRARDPDDGEGDDTEDDFAARGAGVPRPSLPPEEIVPLLMRALRNVDHPAIDGGLEAMWEFAGDTTRFVFQNNRTEFIESCRETAAKFPTSFYGAAMHGRSWAIETGLNRVGGGTAGSDESWIATQVTSTVSSDGRVRRWQWELRKNRRPPCLGCWRVEAIASSDRKGNFEPE